MKICILTPRFPFPECGGDLLRINNIARYLKSKGHYLILVSYIEDSPDIDYAKSLYDEVYVVYRHKWRSAFYSACFLLRGLPIQCGYYYSKSFKHVLDEVVKKEQPDLFLPHLLRMISFLQAPERRERTIVEMTDALSKTYSLATKAKGNRLLKFIYMFEKSLMCHYEESVLRSYPKVVLVSQSDIDYFQAKYDYKFKSLALHTNGVETKDQRVSYSPGKICFIGHMQSLQNQDAVIHFVKNIFPLILNEEPNTKFYVVGAHPPKNILKLANGNNIFVTGFVDNLIATIEDSCIAVAPVRIAAGIQNKVLVAMGCHVPVVLTPLIAQSIPELKDGVNCYIKDDDNEFAACCVNLMRDKMQREVIADAGYAVVKNHYSWEEKLQGYETL